MNIDEKIKCTEVFVRQRMQGFDSGHDWWHIERVRRIAKYINAKESLADPFILDISALLHDTVDSKFRKDDSDKLFRIIEEFLDNAGMDNIKNNVIEVIRNVSFSNKNPTGNLKDPVLLVLQDADRLDAIGAIGIARAFNYGGYRNSPIFIPKEQSEGNTKTTIDHFYEKLLKLKDLMNSTTGRAMAEERHLYIENYLKQFYKEWNAEV
jgi:uncharacterized protein